MFLGGSNRREVCGLSDGTGGWAATLETATGLIGVHGTDINASFVPPFSMDQTGCAKGGRAGRKGDTPDAVS